MIDGSVCSDIRKERPTSLTCAMRNCAADGNFAIGFRVSGGIECQHPRSTALSECKCFTYSDTFSRK
jgi:hypothetical protein